METKTEGPQPLLKEISKGLLKWYDFRPGREALYVGSKDDAAAELLAEADVRVSCVSLRTTLDASWQKENAARFDYLVSIETLEREQSPLDALRAWKGVLREDGVLLLGMNNRFGLKYFCGDRDPYTERNFDGIENYCRAYGKEGDAFYGRCYSRAEIRTMLRKGGFDVCRCYSVLPGLQNPGLLYAEDFLPNEDLTNRVFPVYRYPETVFLEEEGLYNGLIANGMFHETANAYLFECPLNGECADVLQVTGSLERERENALFTVIRKSGVVEKRAVWPEGRERLRRLTEHGEALTRHGICVVPAELTDGTYRMPYIKAETGQLYLNRLLRTDRKAFVEEMDRFRDLILQSSEIVREDTGDGEGALLKEGYPDMVPLNSFYADGRFIFYDQEFHEENYPANAVLFRMLASFYYGNPEAQKLLPVERLQARYGLSARLSKWRQMEWEFLRRLRRWDALRAFHRAHDRNPAIVHSNRQRINYSADTYQRLFVDIFAHADTRKLFLFGSGNFARQFLELYADDYPVYAIADNNRQKWGAKCEGIEIVSPETLRQQAAGTYKVMICIKDYLSVMKQLDGMGVSEYAVYDPDRNYPRKRRPVAEALRTEEPGEKTPKKYHVGYIAGVFDLFHIGHLNMFRRAKEQCEYLIVGVVSDEGVRDFKGTEPFVPFTERIEMVRACRFVDEAVRIPYHFRGITEAWKLYHFDVQFSGSDYMEDTYWLEQKEFLEKHGAALEFFPYTQSTSSTKLKGLIEKKLL